MNMSAPSTTLPLLDALKETSIGVAAADKNLALQVLESTPLPTTRTEAWKYTRVSKLGKINFQNHQAEIQDVHAYLPDADAPHLVFVNGHFHPALSLMPTQAVLSVRILDAESTLEGQYHPLEGEFFNALHTAYLHGGCEIHVSANAQVEEKIQLVHISKGEAVLSNFRTIIRLGKNASANATQIFVSEGEGSAFCNPRTEIHLEENTRFTLDKIQFEGGNNFHIGGEWIEQARDSHLTLNTVTLNGGLVRNDVHVRVNGNNCTSNLNGAYLLKDQQHVDNHTVIDHRVAHCESNELYKGVIDDKGTAVFNGKVFVRKDAQKINAFQSNGNVILSETGSVNSKPELEIYADDVKCSHGSTTGQLDEEAVFYLRARGVSEKAARQLMVAAFVEDVLEKIEDEHVLTFVHRLLKERFGWEFNQ